MKKAAIFCEGKTDEFFLTELIEHLGFNSKGFINFYKMGGKSNFLKKEKYDNAKLEIDNKTIDKILFVIDADDDFENTYKELTAVIADFEFQAISDIYIMCNPQTKTGYLESLILSTISPEQRHCIECFLQCSHFESKEHHKATFNQIYKLAYPQAPYNFEHPHFDELKQKINLLNLSKTNA